ncbi:MAG TPA: DUF6057 family protein [Candidatus Paceibacterota bacterium]|nr:DUF6057 family protein [Verrucomicrobiota bacterium]HRY52214.1 DUF6057 family protein [Candidatus Paceibacterota bacterium]HSA02251.1 DUF6057 family protein [Candidatus Paceibacterota bacterium]
MMQTIVRNRSRIICLTVVLLMVGVGWLCHSADSEVPVLWQPQRPLEKEDWPAALNSLRGDPLTNLVPRLVAVRALYETGRLPEEQFAWFHSPGPELLSTADLKQYVGAACIADVLLQLGHLNLAERLAFDSLEFEGENALALRTLVRLHVLKELPVAARIFLNRLQALPEHSAWAGRFRAGLDANSLTTADPAISRIQTNLITRDEIVKGLTTERILRLALESNPGNRMAVQFLMAHYLLERRLPNAVRVLTLSSQTRQGPLPRHYAEAVLLHRKFYPNFSLSTLLPRVPPEAGSRFEHFKAMMDRTSGSLDGVQPEVWRDFGKTYWYYYFFGASHSNVQPTDAKNP